MKLRKKRCFEVLSLALLACFSTSCDRGNNSGSLSTGNPSNSVVSTPSTAPSTTPSSKPSVSSPSVSDSTSTSQTPSYDLEKVYTVSEAVELAHRLGENTTMEFKVKGTIKSFVNYYYGQVMLTDGTSDISIYGIRGLNDKGEEIYFDALDYSPIVGDTVVLKGILHEFNGESEFKRCHLLSVEKTHTTPSVNEYTTMSIKDGRNANVSTKVKFTGVVAFITRTQSMNYNGFYLVDGTGSIFVYGGMSALQVKVGNQVTVIGEVEHYVYEKEAVYAAQLGYQGAIQITNTYVVENDKGEHEFDKTWIQESSVKDILDTDVKTKNITTDTFKVKTTIRKAPGNGFTNYYINDLDGKTGTYVYTSNNGKDFSYLDNYLDQILNVYVSPINCKSTVSGYVYRFIPLAIEKIENYTFDLTQAPKFALKYAAMGQFSNEYAGDPNLVLEKSYSNSLLKFENVSFSYSSDNTALAYFEKKDGNTIFHVNEVEEATANITVTATYGETTATDTIAVHYFDATKGAKNVKEAIDVAVDTKIKIRGVVSGKICNKVGFYVTDSTGSIACLVSKDDLATVFVGDEVVLEGTRTEAGKTDKNTGAKTITQIQMTSCDVIGIITRNNAYSTAAFEESTIHDLMEKENKEATAKIYTTSAYIEIDKSNPKYPQPYLFASKEDFDKGKDGKHFIGDCMRVYNNGEKDYGFLLPFVGKQVKVEMAIVNFNGTSYLANPISVDDGTTKAYSKIS